MQSHTSDQWTTMVSQYLAHLTRLGISHLPHHHADWLADAAQLMRLNDLPPEAAITNSTVIPPQAKVPEAMDQDRSVVRDTSISTVLPSQTSTGPLIDSEPQQWQTQRLVKAQRTLALDALAHQVAGCTRCEVLSCRRNRTVFGEGNHEPRICFFGEAPGADEDRSGRPFVGAAGQLLDKIISACTFRREDVFIMNTVKCRPPENRNPTDSEVANCREYFETQFELLQPEYIVCLGLVAARAILPSAPSIGRLRSRFHHYRGAKVLVTYHPSYLLRNPAAKSATWEDMKMLLRDMKIELPKRG